MNCTSCGHELGASDATCPNCGQAVGAPAAVATATARPGGSAAAFKFDRSRWSTTDLVAGVATLVMFISLFLPWFGVSLGPVGITVDGLTAHGYLYIPLILALVEIGYLVTIAGMPEIRGRVPVPHEMLLAVINIVSLVLVLIGFLDKGGSGIGWRFGAFVALIAAAVAAAPKLAVSLSGRVRR
ncbi:MAG: zinc ribbon domain-containing protein [Acidimicrobiales bacterium]